LKDDGCATIKGSSDVRDREGSIEVISFTHGLHIPVDGNTGKQTGTRVHGTFTIGKEFDSSSTFLYKAVATGQMLKVLMAYTVLFDSVSPVIQVLVYILAAPITAITPDHNT